jgi:hypothetical protein
MLFDLRGSGRRTTVKAVYITLAILMGGGLVFFGIGGATSGGLFDAITNQNSSGATDDTTLQKKADDLQRRAAASPQDAELLAEAIRARAQYARAGDNFDPNTGQFTAGGLAQLRIASSQWEKYLALDPKPPDDGVATVMVRAYIGGLQDVAKAATAQEIVAEARPKSRTYADLAQYAYAAGQINKGDLATAKAIELADPADRETLKADLKSAKEQAAPAPTPTPTPGKKKDKKSDAKD